MRSANYSTLGFLLLVLGVSIIIKSDSAFYSDKYGFNIDLTEYKYLFGFLLSALGMGFLRTSMGYDPEKEHDENEAFICLQCRVPICRRDAPDLKCKECGRDLESVKGFFERHPELKEKN
ncbi:hypothetical protein [Desulfatibacillum aliphaticivorans]|uniref:hypothetical protein n=1 Tax=Desulfatibacillum aliphaticivorans TaxID=218208 RepID=UPI0004850DBB|nr:hypothetical protein [Desulfatibacillum aliphaticivorans]